MKSCNVMKNEKNYTSNGGWEVKITPEKRAGVSPSVFVTV